VSDVGMTDEEIVLAQVEAGEVDYIYWQVEQRKWYAEQRAKAQVIRGLLRQHLPAQVLQEAEELLSTEYGCKYVCHLHEREPKRRALLKERPEAESEEIESFLDTGIWRSKDELAACRAEREAMIDPEELPW
jgi:hypothetical protein